MPPMVKAIVQLPPAFGDRTPLWFTLATLGALEYQKPGSPCTVLPCGSVSVAINVVGPTPATTVIVDGEIERV